MKNHYSIGILFADLAKSGLTHDYFAGILDSFKRAIEANGHNTCFLNCNKGAKNRKTYLEQAEMLHLDGILISCIEYDDPEVQELLNSNFPLITIDEEIDSVMSIQSDNTEGIKNLIHYIAEMGHRKIAYIVGDNTTVTSIRLKGFLDTCKEMGITIPHSYIRYSKYRDMDKASYETEQLLRLSDPPTCILYSDDYAAIGGINVLRARGLDIPKDISVAGYDGIRILSKYEPRLTTIRQNLEEIGLQAANQLIKHIQHPDESAISPIVVETVLETGRTVGQVYYQ